VEGLRLLGMALVAVGFLGLVMPGLPGTPLVFAGIVAVAWADGFSRIGMLPLVTLAVLAVVSAAVDYAAGVLGARKAGASAWGVGGGVAGLAVGLFFGPIGIVAGPFLGAVALEYWRNPDARAALRAGAGVVIGFLAGAVLKIVIACAMVGIAALAYLL
jgi:uncharacterized protein YqgC (DUF456 family)